MVLVDSEQELEFASYPLLQHLVIPLFAGAQRPQHSAQVHRRKVEGTYASERRFRRAGDVRMRTILLKRGILCRDYVHSITLPR